MLLILLFYRRWNQGKEKLDGISLMAQWLRLCAPNARGPISIPGWGTSSHTTTGSLRMPPWRLKILHAAPKRVGTATNDKNKKTPNWTIHEKNKIKTDQPETLSCGALQQRESLSIHLWKRVRKAGQGAGTAGPIGWPPQQRWVRSDPLLQIKPESLLQLLHRAGKMATVIKKKKKKKERLLSGIICKQVWEFTGQMLALTESEGWDLAKKAAQLINSACLPPADLRECLILQLTLNEDWAGLGGWKGPWIFFAENNPGSWIHMRAGFWPQEKFRGWAPPSLSGVDVIFWSSCCPAPWKLKLQCHSPLL